MSSVRGTLLDSFLWIESDRLEPDQLTAALELEPVVVKQSGRIEIDLDGTTLDPLPGQWIARTAGHRRSSSVDEHLQFLLSRLEPHRALMRELAASPNGRVWVGLEFVPKVSGEFGMVLDAAMDRAMRDVGADLWLLGPGEIPGGSTTAP